MYEQTLERVEQVVDELACYDVYLSLDEVNNLDRAELWLAEPTSPSATDWSNLLAELETTLADMRKDNR